MDKEYLIKLLLKYGIIKINFEEPTFKSGICSPIYFNFRECLSNQNLMEIICYIFSQILPKNIDGIVSASANAISHVSFLAVTNNLPSGYIQPGAKIDDYNSKNLIEDIDVTGKNIMLIDDVVLTADRIINSAKLVEQYGAKSVSLFSIFSYNTKQSKAALTETDLSLKSILTIDDVPCMSKFLSPVDFEKLTDWASHPEDWSK